MMMHTTLEQLRGLKLNGMAAALHDQLSSTGMNSLSFEERMAHVVWVCGARHAVARASQTDPKSVVSISVSKSDSGRIEVPCYRPTC
jgi:hypothetical protein